jgi:AcrR family transcriptional regulator
VRYFGSKEGLFTAASRLSLDLGWVADIAVDRLGPELVRHFLSRWDSGAGTDPFIGLLRAATTNDTAARLLRDVIAEQCHAPLVSRLPGPDAELRVGLVGSFLLGLGLSRYVLRQDALADVSPDIVAAAVAPVLQHYLTGDLNPVACLD